MNTNYSENNQGIMRNFDGNIQGICPRGWHVPTDYDLQNLDHWLNTSSNITSFSPEYAGLYGVSGGYGLTNYMYLLGVNDNGIMSNTELMGYFRIQNTGVHNYNGHYNPLGNGMSVRCVQDIDY